jgi:hypothetical protein
VLASSVHRETRQPIFATANFVLPRLCDHARGSCVTGSPIKGARHRGGIMRSNSRTGTGSATLSANGPDSRQTARSRDSACESSS